MLWFYHYTDEAGYLALTSGRQFLPSGVPLPVNIGVRPLDGFRVRGRVPDAEERDKNKFSSSLGSYLTLIAKFPDASCPGVSADAAYGKGWYVTDLPPGTPTDPLLAALWPGGANRRSRTEYWLLLAAREDRVRIPDSARPNVNFLPLCTGFTCESEWPRPKISSHSSIYLLEAGTRREEGMTLSSFEKPLVVVPAYFAFVDGFSFLSQVEQRRLLSAFGESHFENEDPLEWLRQLYPETVGTPLGTSDGSNGAGVAVMTITHPGGSDDPDVGDWTTLSDSLYSAGHVAAALACANAALEQGPHTPEAWLNRGASLSALKAYDDALAAYDRALEYRPDYQQAVTSKAGLLIKRARYAEALALLETVLATEPENVSALNNKATALSRLGRLDDALTIYEQALAIDQQIPEVWNGLGAVLMSRLEARRQSVTPDTLRRILESFWRALQIRPAYASARENLRKTVGVMTGLAPAVHHYALMICRETGDRYSEGLVLNNLGEAFRELGRFEEATGCYQQALTIERERGDRRGESMVLNNLGAAYQGLQRPQEAIECYQRSLAIKRETGDRRGEGRTLNNLGIVYWDLQRFKEAIDCYQQDIAICSETGDRHGEGQTLSNLGVAYRELRRFKEAINCFQSALVIRREIGDRHGVSLTLSNLGVVYLRQRRLGKAAACWREAAAVQRDAGENEAADGQEDLAMGSRSRQRRRRGRGNE